MEIGVGNEGEIWDAVAFRANDLILNSDNSLVGHVKRDAILSINHIGACLSPTHLRKDNSPSGVWVLPPGREEEEWRSSLRNLLVSTEINE